MAGFPPSPDLLPPALLLLLLGAAALAPALSPTLRKGISWGRGADRRPVSRGGCLGAAAALLLMGGGLLAAGLGLLPAPAGLLLVLLGIAVLVGTAVRDQG